MNEFLKQVAGCYYKEFGKSVGECCFVFPNRRSALFFRKHLGECAGTPIIAPRLMSINDLFSELSGLETVGKIPALDMLYRHYAKLMWPGEELKESFDDFVFWGDTLLNDFDDVDKYLVKARDLFTNIEDLNQIDAGYSYLNDKQLKAIKQFWGTAKGSRLDFDGESRLDKKAEFKSVWGKLFDIYTGFKEDLRSQGKGYEGMIYREVAEGLNEEGSLVMSRLDKFLGYKRIVFVGLNALNKCEKALLSALKNTGKGDYYWDYCGKMVKGLYDYYKDSEFLPLSEEGYDPIHKNLDEALAQKQEFRSIAVPSAVGQTRLACSLLAELASKPGFVAEETAIVLPDENLLMPMLGALPECIKDVNVTMGFPLSASNVATFLKMLDRLHRNCRSKSGQTEFYHKDVIALLTHPFIRKGLGKEGTIAEGLVADIRKNNTIFSQEAVFAVNELLATVFRKVDDVTGLPAYLHSVITALQERLGGLDKEFIYHLDKCVTSLENYGLKIEKATFFKLLGRLAEVIKVQFSGEPLKGLQIMGPLETRALDFKNIIILSANEGTFPKRSVSNSFIPYNLRKGFGLPTYEFQDAVSAYHFYRSICRAENVTFLFDSRMEGVKSGEASRYIKQLKYLYGVPVSEEVATFVMGGTDNVVTAPVVEKDEKIMTLLEDRFLRGDGRFSASSLNTYLDCRLKFYYSHVLRVSEADDVTEGLDASLFGKVFHRSMENIYKPYEKEKITKETIDGFSWEHIGKMIDEAFEHEAKIKEVTGRNLIVKDLIIKYIEEVLKTDRDKAPFTFLSAERDISFKLPIEGRGTVTIKGVIDRMDLLQGGKTQIIDYKTGTVGDKAKVGNVEAMFSHSDDVSERPSITFQMYLYNLLALGGEVSDKCGNYVNTIYSLREIFDGHPVEQIYSKESLMEFKDRLCGLIEEILDQSVPFSPNEKNGKCRLCNYKTLCNRWED